MIPMLVTLLGRARAGPIGLSVRRVLSQPDPGGDSRGRRGRAADQGKVFTAVRASAADGQRDTRTDRLSAQRRRWSLHVSGPADESLHDISDAAAHVPAFRLLGRGPGESRGTGHPAAAGVASRRHWNCSGRHNEDISDWDGEAAYLMQADRRIYPNEALRTLKLRNHFL
jgi:hypothetical protein